VLIDLTSNENPYKRNLNIDIEEANRYTSVVEIDKVIKKIAEYSGISKERIILDYGTDKLVERVILSFYKNRSLYVINPNNYGFISFAKNVGMKVKRLQLSPPEFKIDWMNQGIKNSIIVIDYPNNPTGKLLIDEHELKELLKDNMVIIDEAGFEYSNSTFKDLLETEDNLFIVRSLDKAFGLAGIKAGYLAFSDNIIEKIDRRCSLNKASLEACSIALNDMDYLNDSVSKTIKLRSDIDKRIKDLGIKVFESKGNYILIYTEIPDFALLLKKKGILIEDLSLSWLRGYYRITIGDSNQMDLLISYISNLIK